MIDGVNGYSTHELLAAQSGFYGFDIITDTTETRSDNRHWVAIKPWDGNPTVSAVTALGDDLPSAVLLDTQLGFFRSITANADGKVIAYRGK